jgi:hypothetical protein
MVSWSCSLWKQPLTIQGILPPISTTNQLSRT